MESTNWGPAVIGFVGVLVGGIVSGVFTLFANRIERQAAFQRDTLEAVQQLLVTYVDASVRLQGSLPAGYKPEMLWMPPTRPTDDPLESWMAKEFNESRTQRTQALLELDRLHHRVKQADIRETLGDLLAIRVDSRDFAGIVNLSDTNQRLNRLIGTALRNS